MQTKKRIEIFKITGLFFFSVFLSLAFGEAVVRLLSSQKLIYNLEMVKYAKQLKVHDPQKIMSHIHKANSSANLMGVEISLNALGQRAKEFSDKKKDVKRILVLGSSVTMGWGIPFEDVFTSQAQRIWNRAHAGKKSEVEIINAGVGNYNTYFQLELFKRQYPLVKPDVVFLNFFISDVEARTMGNNNIILRYSLLADLFYDYLIKFIFRMHNNNDLFSYYNALYADDSRQWVETLGFIDEIRQTVEADGGSFGVLIAPDFHDLRSDTDFREIYEKIDLALLKKGIYSKNTFDTFSRAFGGREQHLWVQFDDPHPNAAGHAILADFLLEMIQKKVFK